MADPFKFTNIAFAGREFLGPYSKQALLALQCQTDGLALDIGCANGAVMQALELQGIGIDENPFAIEGARKRNPSSQFYAQDAKATLAELQLEPDLVVCLGASQAIGTPSESLAYFAKLLKPGGQLLFGDGFWEKEPSQGYLEFLQASIDELSTFEEFKDSGRPHGFQPLRHYKSTPEDWDSFEDDYYGNVISWCDKNPTDPDQPAFRERILAWRKGYETWGRGTLGFAIVLYERET